MDILLAELNTAVSEFCKRLSILHCFRMRIWRLLAAVIVTVTFCLRLSDDICITCVASVDSA